MADVQLAWGAATDPGQRAENQDGAVARPPVFAVADGMGGHAAGSQASAAVVDRLAALADELGPSAGGGPPTGLSVERLRAAVAEADATIRQTAESLGDARGMGTTVAGVALVESEGELAWAAFHVGDSRIYRLAGGELVQISTDHSVVQELVDRGMITAADAAVHPQRHLVTRALGVGPESQADVALLPIEPGERWLICSDGLSGELEDDEITELLVEAPDAASAAEELVAVAAERGAADNVTAVVVDVLPAEQPTDPEAGQASG